MNSKKVKKIKRLKQYEERRKKSQTIQVKEHNPILKKDATLFSSETIKFTWKDIYFNNGEIKIKKELGGFTYPYSWVLAKESYNSLQPYLNKKLIVPLTAQLLNNRILKIENLEEINKALEFAKISKEVSSKLKNENGILKIEKIETLKKLSPKSIIETFSANKSSKESLFFLAELQSNNFKIIPVIETYVSPENKTTRQEDSFIFSVENGDTIISIWESTKLKKATHVFEYLNEERDSFNSKIHAFIASDEIKYKRLNLHSLDSKIRRELKHIQSINHHDFADWKNKILSLFKIRIQLFDKGLRKWEIEDIHKNELLLNLSFTGQKTDWDLKNTEAAEIGKIGEELVLKYEKESLVEIGRSDLAEIVQKIDDGKGYDIESRYKDGTTKFIEVKTTTWNHNSEFIITNNEIEFSERNSESYHLYRLFNLDKKNKLADFYEYKGNLKEVFTLQATQYKASATLNIKE